MGRRTNSVVWGSSIALSWTWGLGLFFSVQMALHFGLAGLLSFAIPNALGLIIFGILTQRIADRHPQARDFERHFFTTSDALRFVIIAYQIFAITLTFFAALKYLFLPLGLDPALGALLFLGAALALGEQFSIAQIKWSHGVAFLAIIACMVVIALSLGGWLHGQGEWHLYKGYRTKLASWEFTGFLIPMIAGLLIGPWLDIQQWQRAIQISREETSVRLSYFFGAAMFFGILLFHGFVALAVVGTGGESLFASYSPLHAKDAIVQWAFVEESTVPRLFKVSYFVFLCLCIITTLDSGYVALRWYLKDLMRKSEHLIFSLIPEAVMASPVPYMLICVGIAYATSHTSVQLEYYMSFYASFSVGYAIVFLFRTTYKPQFTNFTQTTLFSVAAFSVALFGIGYFKSIWVLMVIGSVLPLVHGFVTISSRVVVDDVRKALPHEHTEGEEGSVSAKAAERARHALETAISRLDPKVGGKLHAVIDKIEPAAAQALASVLSHIQPSDIPGNATAIAHPIEHDAEIEHAQGHFEGKWFTYTFMATYQDTNSVGNVYFGQYVLWVGKVREMFFRTCLPGFDLRNSPYYILTRSIEHKFNAESKEFEIITVKIRVESYNRKFATLEHNVFSQGEKLLGKGKQVLLFVSAKDYGIIDMPNEVRLAFLPHV